MKIAILASGNGSNAQAILDAIKNKAIKAEIAVIISNRPQAYVLERAKEAGVAYACVDHSLFANRESFDAEMVKVIQAHQADLIVLAGYMRLLSSVFLNAFQGRIINIHPSLLPAFGGGVHAAVDATIWGVRLAGCTVHFVDEEVDNGAIIAQAACFALPKESGEDLQKRIHKLEHKIYPQVIQWFAAGRVKLEGRHVFIDQAKEASGDGTCLFSPALETGFIEGEL